LGFDSGFVYAERRVLAEAGRLFFGTEHFGVRQRIEESTMRRVMGWLRAVTNGTIYLALLGFASSTAWSCDNCGCDRRSGNDSCEPHAPHAHQGGDHSHGGPSITSFDTGPQTGGPAAGGGMAPVSFIVMGDTEINVGDGKLQSMMPAVTALNPDFVVFPGDLVTDGGLAEWQDWKQQTAVLGDNRFMVPGNHDRGPGGSAANWQNTFDWLPDSQELNGEKGTDKIDYFVDRGNVRIISIATDIPGEYSSSVPRSQAWFTEVMKDVADRNADADVTNNIDRVFAFSHKPITLEAGTGNDWWQRISGQDGQGGAAATAHLSGHWMLYQNSRPDPNSETSEIVQGTSNGSFFEGPPHRNQWGFTRITVEGDNVTTEYYGDPNGLTGGANFQLVDTTQLYTAGVVPRGEQALYQFEAGAEDQDSSASPLSKGHTLNFSGASIVNDPQRGSVLNVTGSGAHADAKNIGEGNLAILGDLTLEIAAKFDGAPGSNSVLASFGRSVGALNGGVNSRESGNYAYILAVNSDGTIRLEWEHDGHQSVSVNSTAPIDDLSQWNDIKVVRDHDTLSAQFIVNDQQLGQVVSFGESPTGAGAASLYIGGLASGGGDFSGWLDDLRISDALVDVTPPLLGDINGDGFISGDGTGLFADDDVTAFISFWLQEGSTPADLNFDGITSIADWGILNELDPSMGAAALAALAVRNGVPEPATGALLLLGVAACFPLRHSARTRRAL